MLLLLAMLVSPLVAGVAPAQAANNLAGFLAKAEPKTYHPQADRFGRPTGSPPMAPLYGGEKLLGHVILNSDWVNSIGYSGKPIDILIGLDPKGIITGVRMVKHAEPIVLVGIPVSKVHNFIKGYVGKDAYRALRASDFGRQ